MWRSVSVAVLPIANLTRHPDAGRIIEDLLASELYTAGAEVRNGVPRINDLRLQLAIQDRVLDETGAHSIGESLGVAYVIYGSVSEFRYLRTLDQNPTVGLNLRLLHVPTGSVENALSISRTGGGPFSFGESLNELALTTCRQAVRTLRKPAQPSSAAREIAP